METDSLTRHLTQFTSSYQTIFQSGGGAIQNRRHQLIESQEFITRSTRYLDASKRILVTRYFALLSTALHCSLPAVEHQLHCTIKIVNAERQSSQVNTMLSAFRRYFRAGHIAMAPMADISQIISQGLTPASSLHFPFSTDRHHRLDTYNGSAAIAAVVQRMALGSNDSVLLPAYCCGAELGPFRDAGCQVVFYDINTDLSVNREQINSLPNRHPNIRLLFITHYFGLPQPDMQNLARWCQDNQITLVEDCAHALYGRSREGMLGRFGEYAVFSQRKFLPVCEGGLLVFRERGLEQFDAGQQKPPPLLPGLVRLVYSISQRQRCRAIDSSLLQHLKAILVITAMAVPAILGKVIRRTSLLSQPDWTTPDAEGCEAIPIYSLGVSERSRKTWTMADTHSIVKRRRMNYNRWLQAIAPLSGLEALTAELPEGMCPLYFPVRVDRPQSIVQALAEQDIEAFNWWHAIPDELSHEDPRAFPVALALKRQIVALPVHQQLDHHQIRRMARALKAATETTDTSYGQHSNQ